MRFYVGHITSSLKATYYPWANVGDYIYHNQDHVNGADHGLFVIQSGSHNEKNHSIGSGSIGYTAYQAYLVSSNLADLAPSISYQNHNADGSLRYVHGNTGGNYTGAIGKRVWGLFEDHEITVENSGGHALFRLTGHGMTTGRYVMNKNYAFFSQYNTLYSGYYYIEVINADTWKCKFSATGGYVSYVSDQTIKFSITLGASKMEGMDCAGISDNDRVLITNAPGSQWIMRKNWESVVTYGWEFYGGGKFVELTGEYDPVYGTGDTLYRCHLSGYGYRDGKYGIWIQFYNELTNNPILYIKGGATNWKIHGVQIDGGGRGFAAIMCKNDNQPSQNQDNMIIYNCLIQDVEGEGIYFQNTGNNTPGSSPSQAWGKLHLYNCVFLNLGVEGLQAGQLYDGSIIENNVVIISDTTHHKPFFFGQSNAEQKKDRTGTVISRRNIIYCFAVNATLVQSNRADEVAVSKMIIENCAYSHGMQRVGYYSLSNAVANSFLEYRDCDFKSIYPYNTDRLQSQEPDENELWLTTDPNAGFKLINCTIDLDMQTRDILVGGGLSSTRNWHGVKYATVPEFAFKRSGYEGLGDLRNVHEYFQKYAAIANGDTFDHPLYPGEDIEYVTTDILLYRGLWYEVNAPFSGGNPPSTNPSCTQIFWDSNGWNSLHPDYNGTPYAIKPIGNVILEKNTHHNRKKRGVSDNEGNDEASYFYWQMCHQTAGSPDEDWIIDMKILDKPSYDSLAEIRRYSGTGVYVRRVYVAVSTEGEVLPPDFSPWVLV